MEATDFWVAIAILSVPIAYGIQFAESTRTMGRKLVEAESGNGVQDAITPPWQTNVGLLVYLSLAAVIGFGWWQLGWRYGVGGIVGAFVATSVARAILPKAGGNHYQRAILRSMVKRYADFVRTNDAARAVEMRELLERAGVEDIRGME